LISPGIVSGSRFLAAAASMAARSDLARPSISFANEASTSRSAIEGSRSVFETSEGSGHCTEMKWLARSSRNLRSLPNSAPGSA
jgi:hypothetical protein